MIDYCARARHGALLLLVRVYWEVGFSKVFGEVIEEYVLLAGVGVLGRESWCCPMRNCNP